MHPQDTHQLQRQTFATSRLMDFFSEKELTAQTGARKDTWPLVVLKELVDNALDACEEAGVAPEITIEVDEAGITVADNGPGIPPETVEGVLDFSVRVSSREAYVAPDRGAQGNALMTIVAMPFVLDGDRGTLQVTAQGVAHDITIAVDPIRQQPAIDHTRRPVDATAGTRITVGWPDSARSILDSTCDRFLQLADDYAWLNPHATIAVEWLADGVVRATDPNRPSWYTPKYEQTVKSVVAATDPGWRKWKPTDPTCPHWYGPEHLERLIAAYVVADEQRGVTRSVREFVREFRGLTSTAKGKAVLTATGLARTNLADLANGQLDRPAIGRLLAAMQEHSKPVTPAKLGIIGRDHLERRLAAIGCEMDSFNYKKVAGDTDGIPWVIETAFGYCPDLERRRLVTGVNWSPGIVNPFRELGKYGQSLDTVLANQRANSGEPVALFLHLACPRVRYTDRGKSAVVID